jgi:hypothetical protein
MKMDDTIPYLVKRWVNQSQNKIMVCSFIRNSKIMNQVLFTTKACLVYFILGYFIYKMAVDFFI